MATSCPLLPCGNFGPNNAQLTWLEQDLAQAQADRKLRPWIFVSGHRPIYRTDDMNPDGSPSGEAYNLQQALEGLFAKYDVDMYFAGHQHSYQRTYPVLNNTVETSYVNPKFPVHLIVGGAGCDEMSGKTATNPLGDGDSDPAWLAAKDTTHYGMGILNVYNVSVAVQSMETTLLLVFCLCLQATTVRWTWYESKDGSVLDQITLVKDSH
jgi:Calcineurin-like phosphoesterase/Iron/zinc purple acid phosphatase-like protein C